MIPGKKKKTVGWFGRIHLKVVSGTTLVSKLQMEQGDRAIIALYLGQELMWCCQISFFFCQTFVEFSNI